VLEQLPLFFSREFVVEGYEDAAAVENGIGRNQPLGLIGHDNGGAVGGFEGSVLHRLGEGMGALFELLICETFLFSFAIGFDQAYFTRNSSNASFSAAPID